MLQVHKNGYNISSDASCRSKVGHDRLKRTLDHDRLCEWAPFDSVSRSVDRIDCRGIMYAVRSATRLQEILRKYRIPILDICRRRKDRVVQVQLPVLYCKGKEKEMPAVSRSATSISEMPAIAGSSF